MRIFLLFLFILNLILFIPIVFKCKVYFDFCKNKGVLSIYFFGFCVNVFSFKLMANKILVKDKRKNINFLYYADLTSQTKFGDIFFLLVFRNLDIRHLRFDGRVGIGDNPFFTSLLCAGLGTSLNIGGTFLCQNESVKSANVAVVPDYLDNSFLFGASSVVATNLFIMLVCFCEAVRLKLQKAR